MRHNKRLTLIKIESRLRLIEPLIFRNNSPIEPFKYYLHQKKNEKGLISVDFDDSYWPIIETGTYWGQWYSDFTLRTHFTIPDQWQHDLQTALSFNIGNVPGWFCHPEALVYIDGEQIAAVDKFHQTVYIPDLYRDGKEHHLALDGYTGRWGYYDSVPNNKLLMGQSQVTAIDQATRDFVAAVRVAIGTVNTIDNNEPASQRLLNALDNAFKYLDLTEPLAENFYASVPKANEVLQTGIEAAGNPLDVSISAIGHSHIDVAWVWPLDQTRRKCSRTFNTVLALMEESQDYIFTQSQPQLYDYVRQDYPELFDKIKQKVKQGKWEPIGGMWVEADCNITGPESLIRQFTLGKAFFAEHFGKDSDSPVLWLPDVFGYAYNLPQIMKLAGIEYFFTTKMSWNRYNQMPYDTFNWQGLDGTDILTHLGTTASGRWVTYNGVVTPEEILNTWTNCKQKECHSELMTCFGHGDGGGGPTREMIENIKLANNFPALPKVKHAKAIDFFKKLEQSCGDDLPTWNGELYLEGHRGTYTTQAKNKKANRRSEFDLHDCEWLATMVSILNADSVYPHDQLTQAWKLLCLNQFHDIIPGSSIDEVYEDSLKQYEQIKQITDEIKASSLQAIAANVNATLLIANPTSFKRSDTALLETKLNDDQSVRTIEGSTLQTQITEQGTLIETGSIEQYSIKSMTITNTKPAQTENTLIVTENLLENKYIKLELNADGDIVSIYDKVNQRQVLAENAIGNQLQAFEDRPIDWDAWDIDIFYDDKMFLSTPAESITVTETGPLRATIEIKRRILTSSYTQRISLSNISPQIDISTTIDWNQKHILLKAAFPVDVHANFATYEIQWGSVQRPTHHNTSWDWARFEVCAQKWVDLSEGDYGVSLLNDCKYGHDIKDNIMRITLLRSPTMPDPNADQGTHTFAYSLLPHSGPVGTETIAAAYALNNPLIVHQSDNISNTPADIKPFVSADNENVIIETVKQAQDGNGIIVRLYEANRTRGSVTLTTGFDIKSCSITDLHEQDQQQLEPTANTVSLKIKPFEIITLRILPV